MGVVIRSRPAPPSSSSATSSIPSGGCCLSAFSEASGKREHTLSERAYCAWLFYCISWCIKPSYSSWLCLGWPGSQTCVEPIMRPLYISIIPALTASFCVAHDLPELIISKRDRHNGGATNHFKRGVGAEIVRRQEAGTVGTNTFNALSWSPGGDYYTNSECRPYWFYSPQVFAFELSRASTKLQGRS